MAGYYYHAGKCWEVEKLWEATKDNPTEDLDVALFLNQNMYWNIGTFKQLAEEVKLALKADYSYPVIIDEDRLLVDGAHRLVHAYLDGVSSVKCVVIGKDQWPEPIHDEREAVRKNYNPIREEDVLKNYICGSH